MATINQLIVDLERLNKHYSELSDSHNALFTKKDAENSQRRLKEAGQLFVDFYEKTFVLIIQKLKILL